jgi:multiple sugar transport system permease protein
MIIGGGSFSGGCRCCLTGPTGDRQRRRHMRSRQIHNALRSRKHWNEWCWAWGLIAPTMIGLVVLNIIPIFQTVYISFFKSGAFGKGNVFIGLENYAKLMADAQVWDATRNTLVYTVCVVGITTIFALLLAVMLSGKIRGKGVYRTIYFIPMVATPAAVTLVWKWLYNYRFGLVNRVLSMVNISAVNWIDDPNVAMISIIIVGVWSTLGYSMVLLIAGLQEIPGDYYQAAQIDGANAVRQFFNITVPLVSPTLFFVLVTSVITSMQVFDIVYMMLGVASPSYDSTVSLVYLFYNNSFKYSNKGYGSAIIMLLLAIILVITVIQNKLQKRWVNYM